MKDLGLSDFIDQEIKDGELFEDILERFDLAPGEVFQILFDAGYIDEEQLERYILNVG